MKKLLLPAILFSTLGASGQLYIDNATFFIDNGAVVTVQGDVTSNVDIQVNGASGTGKLRMGGTATQNLNMNGKSVPNLQIDNASQPVVMTGNVKVSTLLEFTNGKIQLGNNELRLEALATVTGAGGTKFAETNGTGFVKKMFTAAGSTTIPVGNGSNYTPLNYTTAGGTYNASTFVEARSANGAHPKKHPRSSDYLKNYWKLNNNIAGATVTAVGNYINPASVTGDQADIVSMTHNGTTWAKGTSQAVTSVTAPATANGQIDLYGMNKFILTAPKVFLQGAYSGGGLMTDLLRTNVAYSIGNYPASNIIPTTTPYNSLPEFVSVNNPNAETISTDVLKDLANFGDNIVDWVFLELRTSSAPPTTVVQTRSALLQRDGDVVDVDGVSPIYFENLDPASFNVVVRHRNHLPLRTKNASPLNLTTPLTKTDFSLATNNFSDFAANLGSGVYGMYAGNGNKNLNVRITGATVGVSDYLYLSSILGGNAILSNQYSAADYNMNRAVRISGATTAVSDYLFLSSIIGANATVAATQQ